MVAKLWLPKGVTQGTPSLLGRNVETGSAVVSHSFRFHSATYGKTREVRILADDSMSKAQIEDMAASALERPDMRDKLISFIREIEKKF